MEFYAQIFFKTYLRENTQENYLDFMTNIHIKNADSYNDLDSTLPNYHYRAVFRKYGR